MEKAFDVRLSINFDERVERKKNARKPKQQEIIKYDKAVFIGLPHTSTIPLIYCFQSHSNGCK